MQPMDTAPIDGTHVLVKQQLMHWSTFHMTYVKAGTAVQEAWFDDGRWKLWRGSVDTSTTEACLPLGWWPMPE